MQIIDINKTKKKVPYQISNFKIKERKKFKIKVTKKLHKDFIKFSGDVSPIHTNINFCKSNGFKLLVGHAFLLTAILSKIFGTFYPGGNELCLHQSCNFKKPFFVGDILIFTTEVLHINMFHKAITLKIKVQNQRKKVIFSGESILKLSLLANVKNK